MEIVEGSIWYDTETEEYVEVHRLHLPVRRIESCSSSIVHSQDDVSIVVGGFDRYGPLPWALESYSVQDFVKRHDQTEKTRKSVLDVAGE